MPDLTPITCYTCPDNISWQTSAKGSGDNHYIVSYRSETGWDCSCAGMMYGKTKQCKHIKKVKRLRCTWNEMAFAGSVGQPDNGKCPQCKKKVVAIQVGV